MLRLTAEWRIKFFISYPRHDATFVEQLGGALQARGIDAWIDRREITPTADWLQRIVQGIVQSEVLEDGLSAQEIENGFGSWTPKAERKMLIITLYTKMSENTQ